MFKDKKISLFLIYFISILYLELIYFIFGIESISITFICTIINSLIISIILSIISSLFNEKINKFITRIFMFLLTIFFCIELLFKKILGVTFSLKTLGMSNNLNSFLKDTIKLLLNNIIYIILLFIPFILILIIRKKINYNKINIKKFLIYLLVLILNITYINIYYLINKNDSNSLYNLSHKVDNISLYKEKVGVLLSLELELKRIVLGYENTINNEINTFKEELEPVEEEITYNNLDIDFSSILQNETDNTLKQMHEYMSKETGTKKNKYTGLYKNKNLILFMAESFNSIAVDENLTPTLYKLVNSSFTFNNFYSPVILSTIGGEFQELTGLYPNISLLSKVWRKGNESYEFGIANLFKKIGYNTYAYHDNTYNFQNRDKYLKSIGFDNFTACKNGLEEKINCKIWPQSDVEMINATFDDYASSEEPFLVYYATVSGHMEYNWGNAMSKKNKEFVDNLPYNTEAKAYLASQIELDHALDLLINKLDDKGILDDTVIALVGDHYPYALSLDSINQISSYKRDKTFEINRSNFILWNNLTDNVKVDKIGSQIDVLPTILNVFGIEYDSRMIIGKDILSDNYGLAILSNQSWISDLGFYNSATNTFTKKDDSVVLPDNYIENMNKIVQDKVTMSKLVFENNYYSKIVNLKS